MGELRLDRAQLVELADLVAEQLAERLEARASVAGDALVDAQAVADRYGVQRSWVYAHAAELGAVRLGQGSRGRLRFDLEEAGRRLTDCSAGRESGEPPARMVERKRRRRARPRSGSGAELLPIRGVSSGVDG